MLEAIIEAKTAEREGEIPVGAVIVKDGKIIARGRNTRERKLDISGHAEIEALKNASGVLGRLDLSDCEIYITLEPCLMCAGALKAARIKSIHFGAYDPKEGAVTGRYRVYDDNRDPNHPLIYMGERREECENLLTSFFKKQRNVYH